MIDTLSIVESGLMLLGGSALGAAAGGGLGAVLRWQGNALGWLVAGLAPAGLCLGFVVDHGVKLPDLSLLAGRAREVGEQARFMAVLKAHYPDTYAAAMTADRAQLERIGLDLAQRQLPLADTENALAFLRVTREQQQILSEDPQLCAAMMLHPTPDLLRQMRQRQPAAMRAEEGALAVKLLEQTAMHPQPAHSDDAMLRKAQLWMAAGYSSMTEEERENLRGLGGASQPTDAQARAMCRVFGNMLDQMLRADPDDAADVYKTLAAKGISGM